MTTQPISPHLLAAAAKVQLLILDVDGVLTDGRIFYGADGQEWKVFHVLDGAGIRMLQRGGVRVAIISGRSTEAVATRASELGIEDCFQNVYIKVEAYDTLKARYDLADEAVAYIGDDLMDLPLLRRVGLPIAVPNAVDEVKRCARTITTAPGGWGAVREVAELILESRGAWEAVTSRYLED